MASISNDPNGRRRILFNGADGKRRAVRLGKVSLRFAESVKVKIEDLVSATITGHAPADETSRWLVDLDSQLHDKISAVGLARRRARATLAAFIDTYVGSRTDVKASTRLVFARVRRHMIDFFGADKPLRDITPGDADWWRLHLLDQGLADNTVRRSCGLAKQFLTAAQRQRLVTENPFTDLVAAVKANPKRFHFVSRDDAQRVLDACPDAQWRLLFALARYGGLRVPSEVLRLRWTDIDWANYRFVVSSSKTEHHEGHESRVVPIFPELLPHLREAFEQADEGSEYCITRYRNDTSNLRTQLQRIIRKAGLESWPKLWQNLRSTRETELADQFPSHVASAWIGNSVAVAVKHYLQVTDDHFRMAAQNAAQKPHEGSRNDTKTQTPIKEQESVTSGACESFQEMTTSSELQGDSINGRYRTRTMPIFPEEYTTFKTSDA